MHLALNDIINNKALLTFLRSNKLILELHLYVCFILFDLGFISRRDPESLVKPLKSNSSEKETKNRENELEKQRPTATRHLLLIRHGQYNLDGKEDSERYLTKLGN